MSYRIAAAQCLFLCPANRNSKDTTGVAGNSVVNTLRKQLLGRVLQIDGSVNIATNETQSHNFTVVGIWSPSIRGGEGRITRSTQVFILLTPPVVRPLRVGVSYKRGVDGLVSVHQDCVGDELLRSVDESVSLALCGAFGAFFRGGVARDGGANVGDVNANVTGSGTGNVNGDGAGGSLLVIAPPGTGSVDLAVAAAHRAGVVSVCVSLSALLARGAESADRELRRAVQIAWAVRPCALVVEDLEVLQSDPQALADVGSGSGTASEGEGGMDGGAVGDLETSMAALLASLLCGPPLSASASTPTSESASASASASKQMQGQRQGQGLLVVGCCSCAESDEDWLLSRTTCGALCAQFRQTLRVPLPGAEQQRRLVRSVVTAARVAQGQQRTVGEGETESAGEGERRLVDSLVDEIATAWMRSQQSMTARSDGSKKHRPLPLLALLLEAKKRLARRVASGEPLGSTGAGRSLPASTLMASTGSEGPVPDKRAVRTAAPVPATATATTVADSAPTPDDPLPLSLHLPAVFGHSDVKAALAETLLWPRLASTSRLLRALTLADPRTGGTGSDALPAPIGLAEAGILLYGPPGTGKTLLPAACAAALGCPLLELRLTDVVRAEVGSGEKELMSTFAGAKLVAPCIVFIDEFQAIFTSRGADAGAHSGSVGSTLTSALAACFDEVLNWNSSAGSGALITVLAATNEPWAVDRGFLRPGRLARALFVGPLSGADRIAFVRSTVTVTVAAVDTAHDPDAETEALLSQIGALTEGFTGADIALLLRRARLLAQTAAEGRGVLRATHLLDVLQEGGISPSVTRDELEEYREWRETEYGNT